MVVETAETGGNHLGRTNNMKRAALVLGMLALSACAPAVPDSGDGVGFETYKNYDGYRAGRDAELEGSAGQPANVLPPAQTTPPNTNAVVNASPTNPPPPMDAPVVTLNNPDISDENDFEAVSGRQTIESDAERLRAQREAYQVIEPTAVPARTSSGGPNIVQFALTTTNKVGEKIYRRSSLTTEARYLRNCGKYPSPDLAQDAFMRKGGPERDRLGIDPDGDGFACSWDPMPFRRINAANG
jgi:hypothetical protein